MPEQLRQLTRAQLMSDIKLHTYLKDDPQSAKKVYAKLHMAFDPIHIDRSSRIFFLRELFGRCMIDSFGDLTFAEAKALLAFRNSLRVLYDQTLRG